jgi:hypothetical protein
MVQLRWLALLPKLLGEEESPWLTKEGEQIYGKKLYASEAVRALSELSQISELKKPPTKDGKTPVMVQLNFSGLNGGEVREVNILDHEG